MTTVKKYCNKVDLEASRGISRRAALKWCESKGGVAYFEVSAKEAVNVDAAFQVNNLISLDLKSFTLKVQYSLSV